MTIELGNSIILEGFKEISGGDMIVVKKIVGNYVKNISGKGDFKNIKLTMKKVHETEQNAIFQINAMLEMESGMVNAEVEDRNLFFALDNVFKKLEAQLG